MQEQQSNIQLTNAWPWDNVRACVRERLESEYAEVTYLSGSNSGTLHGVIVAMSVSCGPFAPVGHGGVVVDGCVYKYSEMQSQTQTRAQETARFLLQKRRKWGRKSA
jgi:hypothetical protein